MKTNLHSTLAYVFPPMAARHVRSVDHQDISLPCPVGSGHVGSVFEGPPTHPPPSPLHGARGWGMQILRPNLGPRCHRTQFPAFYEAPSAAICSRRRTPLVPNDALSVSCVVFYEPAIILSHATDMIQIPRIVTDVILPMRKSFSTPSISSVNINPRPCFFSPFPVL